MRPASLQAVARSVETGAAEDDDAASLAANISQLFRAELNRHLKWSEAQRCVLLWEGSAFPPLTEAASRKNGSRGEGRWVRMQGLLQHLETTFYPTYNYNTALRAPLPLGNAPGCVAPVRLAPARGTLPFERRVRGRGRGRGRIAPSTRGLVTGSRVDAALTRLTNDQYRQPARAAAAAGAAAAAIAAPRSVEEELVGLTLQATTAWGWRSLYAQFNVAFPQLLIGTKIDSLYCDEKNRLILVEHKTGYENYLTLGNDRMAGPLRDLSNCPLHQHFLQLGFELLALERLWGVEVHAAFVVQTTRSGVVPHPLPEWFHQRKDALYQYFEQQVARARGFMRPTVL